jgi:hypothetical protein
MRYWAILFCLLFVGSVVNAAPVAVPGVTIEDTGVPRGVELCEILRKEVEASTTTWTLGKCASELLDRGLEQYETQVTGTALQVQMTADLLTALTDLRNNTPPQWDPACPDGVVDVEFGETCDDNDSGGCTAECQTP